MQVMQGLGSRGLNVQVEDVVGVEECQALDNVQGDAVAPAWTKESHISSHCLNGQGKCPMKPYAAQVIACAIL